METNKLIQQIQRENLLFVSQSEIETGTCEISDFLKPFSAKDEAKYSIVNVLLPFGQSFIPLSVKSRVNKLNCSSVILGSKIVL